MMKMDQPNVNFSTDPDNDLTESSHPTQAHEIKMPLSSTLQHTVHAFLMASHPTLPSAATFVLLIGTSGSGKTHLLRTIQDQASSKEDVTGQSLSFLSMK
jgi:chromosomal replication initiation ATPase DnaA